MSHVATYKGAICNANSEFVKAAAQMASEDLGGTFSEKTSIADYVGRNRQDVDMAIFTPTLRYGYGIVLNKDGTVDIKGDAFVGGWHEIETSFFNHYNSLVTQAAAAVEGWPVEEVNQVPGGIDVVLDLEMA